MKSSKSPQVETLSIELASKFQTFRAQTAGMRKRHYPKELVAEVCDAYKAGVPRRDLMKITGVSWANLKRWLQKSPASKKPRRLEVVTEPRLSKETPGLSAQNILIRLKSGVVIELPNVECLSVQFLKTLSVLEVA